MPSRICTVRFIDARGFEHAVDVPAETLFEAAILAVKAFQKSGFGEAMPGPATKFEVEVREAPMVHKVDYGQVMRWLNQHSTNPAETLKRKRLKELLTGKA